MKRKGLFLAAMFAVVWFSLSAKRPVVDDDDFHIWDLEYIQDPTICVATDTLRVVEPSQAADTVAKPKPEPVKSSIMGRSEVTDPQLMARFVRRHNPNFPVEIAEAYLSVGDRYGIRGDIAFCQAIIETGWFKFADGTAVKPDQNNYCGMGVTSRGQTGNSFSTIEEGVAAQIQHLYAYCCKKPLPEGETLVDPRFRLVTRGIAPNWEDLSNRWAMNPNYGNQILKLYNQLSKFK